MKSMANSSVKTGMQILACLWLIVVSVNAVAGYSLSSSANPSANGNYTIYFPEAIWDQYEIDSSLKDGVLEEVYTSPSGAQQAYTYTGFHYTSELKHFTNKPVGTYTYIFKIPYGNYVGGNYGGSASTYAFTQQVIESPSPTPTPVPTPVPTPTPRPTPIPSPDVYLSGPSAVTSGSSFTLTWSGSVGNSVEIYEKDPDDVNFDLAVMAYNTSNHSFTRNTTGKYQYFIWGCNDSGECKASAAIAVDVFPEPVPTPAPAPTVPPTEKLNLSRYDIYYGDFDNNNIKGDIYFHGTEQFVLIAGDITVPIFIEAPVSFVFYSRIGGYDDPVLLSVDNLSSYTKAEKPEDFIVGDVNGDNENDWLIRGYEPINSAIVVKQSRAGFPDYFITDEDNFTNLLPAPTPAPTPTPTPAPTEIELFSSSETVFNTTGALMLSWNSAVGDRYIIYEKKPNERGFTKILDVATGPSQLIFREEGIYQYYMEDCLTTEVYGQMCSKTGILTVNIAYEDDSLPEGNATDTDYEYDALGRLKSVTKNMKIESEYEYDAAGNRTTVIE